MAKQSCTKSASCKPSQAKAKRTLDDLGGPNQKRLDCSKYALCSYAYTYSVVLEFVQHVVFLHSIQVVFIRSIQIIRLLIPTFF